MILAPGCRSDGLRAAGWWLLGDRVINRSSSRRVESTGPTPGPGCALQDCKTAAHRPVPTKVPPNRCP